MKVDRWDFGFSMMVILYMVAVPYTKVEESFNMQAAHDLMEHHSDIDVGSP